MKRTDPPDFAPERLSARRQQGKSMTQSFQNLLVCLLTFLLVVMAVYFLRVDGGARHSGARSSRLEPVKARTAPVSAAPGAAADSHSTAPRPPSPIELPSHARPDPASPPISDSYSESDGYGPPDRDVDVSALYLLWPEILGSQSHRPEFPLNVARSRIDLESLGGMHWFRIIEPAFTPRLLHPSAPAFIPIDPLPFDDTVGIILYPGAPR